MIHAHAAQSSCLARYDSRVVVSVPAAVHPFHWPNGKDVILYVRTALVLAPDGHFLWSWEGLVLADWHVSRHSPLAVCSHAFVYKTGFLPLVTCGPTVQCATPLKKHFFCLDRAQNYM